MAKKRPTLDAFLNLRPQNENEEVSASAETVTILAKTRRLPSIERVVAKKIPEEAKTVSSVKDKREVVRHMLYLPLPVYDQLQSLIFEEQRGQLKRRKTHDYLLDAIDLLFKKKGLKSITELVEK